MKTLKDYLIEYAQGQRSLEEIIEEAATIEPEHPRFDDEGEVLPAENHGNAQWELGYLYFGDNAIMTREQWHDFFDAYGDYREAQKNYSE